jgi:hypothetical protein
MDGRGKLWCRSVFLVFLNHEVSMTFGTYQTDENPMAYRRRTIWNLSTGEKEIIHVYQFSQDKVFVFEDGRTEIRQEWGDGNYRAIE